MDRMGYLDSMDDMDRRTKRTERTKGRMDEGGAAREETVGGSGGRGRKPGTISVRGDSGLCFGNYPG